MKDDTQPLDLGDGYASAEERKIKNRAYKRASRERLGKQVSISVAVTPEEYEELVMLARRSKRGFTGFWRRALIQGALFASNAGQGERVRLADVPALKKGNTDETR